MRVNKGVLFELRLSKKIHSLYPALLVSSKFLRSRNCGQIDISYFSKNEIILLEAKSSPVIAPNYIQLSRLKNSQNLLSKILDLPVRLVIQNKI